MLNNIDKFNSEEIENFYKKIDNLELTNKNSSNTILNTNPLDPNFLNSTKEEDNASLLNILLEEFKSNIINRIFFLEIQLKEKSEKIRFLEKKLEDREEQSNLIQRSKNT